MKLSRKQLIANAIFCSALFIVIMWALYAEYNRPWKKYQRGNTPLNPLLIEGKNPPLENGDEGGEFKQGIQQVYLQELGEADRCITCHQYADNPDYTNKPQPFKPHSGDYLKQHKVEKFGCVSCHDGQGAALTVEAAHGEVENWTKPLLKGTYAQSSCGKCHFINHSLPPGSEFAGAPKFIEGGRLFREYNCNGCHKIEGFERPERIAPSLISIGSKVNKDWLAQWLKNPRDYLPNAKMPVFKLSDEEIGIMADYLMGPDKKNIPLLLTARGSYRGGGKGEGENLVTFLGCLGCHSINGVGNNFAPDLSNIGNKVNKNWLVQYLKNPKAYQAKTAMPDLKLSEEDIQGIVTYLMSLRKVELERSVGIYSRRFDAPPIYEGTTGYDKGKKLLKDKGCTACHEIENFPAGYDAPLLDGIGSKRVDELAFGNIMGVKKTLFDWLTIKVLTPDRFATDKIITRMPDYGFSREQAEALVVFLLSLRNARVSEKYVKPLTTATPGNSIIEKYNCLGCHRINDKGGNIAPDLTREGRKSRPEWLFAFLKSPRKIRPPQILKANMPDFYLSDKEAIAAVEYLNSVSGESYPYNIESGVAVFKEDLQDGEKLYNEIFACIGCHRVEGRGGEIGPDHTDTASRLNRKWIGQWLKDPQSIQPDVRMPQFKFREWEYEALINYLMTQGKYRFVKIKQVE